MAMKMRRPAAGLVLLGPMLGHLALDPSLAGQTVPDPGPPPAAAAPASAELAPRPDPASSQQAAAAVARIAALDLAASPEVSTRDYAIAASLLELAHELAPRDEEILRRLMEAQIAAGDDARVRELGPRLLSLAPRDTVAQLRLISGRVLELQDSDKRLEVYSRFLGEQGAALDASVRSRLALDSALLLRERGDEQGFSERLATAIELDPTNKDAAALAVAYYSERIPDAAGRVELLITLFRADPLDPETHLAIARELLQVGAYRAAGRSYALGKALRDVHGTGLSEPEQAELQLLIWQIEGVESIVSSAAESVQKQRQALEARRQQAIAAGAIESELPTTADVQLSFPVAKVILIAAAATGNAEAIDWAMGEVTLAAQRLLAPQPDASGETPVVDPALQQQVFGDLLWMRLWAGRDLDLVTKQLEALRAAEGINPEALARLEGWYLLRQGELDRAEEALRPLADRDPLALLGLAVAAEAAGDSAGAGSWYNDLYDREAGTVVAAFAKSRLLALGNQVPAPSPLAERLATMAERGVPSWVGPMISDPRSFMSIAIEPDPLNVDPSGRIAVRVRLRNTSPIPLALGPTGPIGSRLLLSPTVEFGLDRATGMQTMEVVSMDRRLRLMPQEALEVTVRPELGSLWYVLNQLGDRIVRLRWRALQGFRLTREGIFVQGPMGLTAESAVQTRQPLETAQAEPAVLLENIRTGDTGKLLATLTGLGWRWAAPTDRGGLGEENVANIAAALAERLPRSSVTERLMILSLTPPASRLPAMAPVDAAGRADDDPAVRSLVLVTRIAAPDDAVLAASLDAADPRLQMLAQRIKARLESGVSTFARPVRAGAQTGSSGGPGQSSGGDAGGGAR